MERGSLERLKRDVDSGDLTGLRVIAFKRLADKNRILEELNAELDGKIKTLENHIDLMELMLKFFCVDYDNIDPPEPFPRPAW